MSAPRSHLLEDFNSLEYILLGDLRDLLEESPGAETRKWLIAVLDALLDTLPREFDLEEEDGYLSEVLERFPSWSTQVDRLHRDHERLFEKLKELRDRVGRNVWIAPIASEVRRELKDWMLSLIAHHRSETRILQTAMTLDVGVGD